MCISTVSNNDNAGTCTAMLPFPLPESCPFYASKDVCCQTTYSSWGSYQWVNSVINKVGMMDFAHQRWCLKEMKCGDLFLCCLV